MRKGKRLPLAALTPYLVNLPVEPAPMDWPAIFANSNPIEMEVGFGKGLFLLTAGQANPHINYLGIEIDRGLQLYTANRIAKRELRNVRLVKADARFFIRDYLAAGSLQAIHVYFPDPWWKKRHKKRRVFTENFARECERVLQPGGLLHMATDIEEYFGIMNQLIQEHTRLQPVADSQKPGFSEKPGFLGPSNFERKARQRGQAIWRAVYQK